jgi:hypothetical protein
MGGSVPISLSVETYSGYKADERPVAFRLEGRRVAIREILDRRYGEDYADFKVTGEDTMVYLIRHDRSSDTWKLILMEVPTVPRPQGEI